jgi:hypothetical protein
MYDAGCSGHEEYEEFCTVFLNQVAREGYKWLCGKDFATGNRNRE